MVLLGRQPWVCKNIVINNKDDGMNTREQGRDTHNNYNNNNNNNINSCTENDHIRM